MTLQTYQSQLVLRTLKSGKTYRARANLKLQGEYEASSTCWACTASALCSPW